MHDAPRTEREGRGETESGQEQRLTGSPPPSNQTDTPQQESSTPPPPQPVPDIIHGGCPKQINMS